MSPVSALTPKKQASLNDYTHLRSEIRAVISAGKTRAQDAVERERVRTSWEIGKLINEHILLNRNRADYGAKVIKRLSVDLGISNTELKYMREFVRTYPAIGRVPGQLNWSQIQILLAINDDEARAAFALRAAKQRWTWEKTRSEIKKLKAAKQITTTEIPAETLLEPKRGVPYTYIIKTLDGRLQIDLGFSNYYLPTGKFPFKDGAIATLEKGKLKSAKTATEADLFTYYAKVLEVTDGDTLWVLVDLGFGFTTKQQLRLCGLDCPEINSREGQSAKKFVERELKPSPNILITSTKSDKYDRYLADVFCETKKGEQYLNNRLLQEGLAVRV